MQVGVLGPVVVLRGDDVVGIGPRLRRLLAALVIADGSVVSLDRLADIVWAGAPPDGAEKTLRTYVTRLRQTLEIDRDGVIIFRPPGYALRLRLEEVDSSVFEDEVDRGRACLATGDARAAERLIVDALERWRGAPYAEFSDEHWARPQAVRLEEYRLEANEVLVEALLTDGQTTQAVAAARALVEIDPMRERSTGLLMRALYAADRQPEALRTFRDFRRMLAEETGLEPSDELAELERRIVRGDQAVASPVRALRGYELGEQIGEGAFAVVHRAVQPGLEREVAIKIIRAELADRPDFVRRFEVEARTIARIEHPNVVPLYDYWRQPGAAYIVMRLLRGGSVASALRSRGPFSRRQVIDLLTGVGAALSAAHRAGVVHRDIRPANLLMDHEGTTYLADFGIALPQTVIARDSDLSPSYAAPEVLRGEPATVEADVLSLGVTVFELLTGRPPFAETTDPDELIRRQLGDPLPPVRATRTDLSTVVDDVLARATAKAPDDRYATISAFVDDLQAAIDESSPRTMRDATELATTETGENPYVGLHAFDEPDADRFHGRAQLTTELIEALERDPFLVVVGPSGSGKSSVVRAGLVPALRRGAITGSDRWFITTMIPGSDPVAALEAALLRVAVNPPSTLRRQLTEPGGLVRAIRRVLPDENAQILMVIDQFEELFAQPSSERDLFLDELAAAVTEAASPLRVVATLRADHYDEPLRHRAMAALVTRGTVTVQPLAPDELEQVVVLPAEACGVAVEPALVAELVAGVSAQPAALPLLQFALTELYERSVSGVMLLSAHRELGALTGALAARADRIVDQGEPDDEAEVRRIFGRLVTLGEGVEATRRRALRPDFGSSERTLWLLDAFISARLLIAGLDESTRLPTIEVAHEALFREWPRLRRWLSEDRDDLRTMHGIAVASSAWIDAGRDPGELARGGRLELVEELAEARPDWLTDDEVEWVAVSSSTAADEAAAVAAAADHDRQQNRRLRQLLVAAAAMLTVAVAAALIAVVLRSRAVESEQAARSAEAEALVAQQLATDNEQVAVAARERAEASEAEAISAGEDADIERLIALSATQIATRPDRAILLALEAHRRRDDISTRTAVHRAIATEPRIVRILPDAFGEASGTRFSDDGTVGVTLGLASSRVAWFDAGTGEPIGRYQAPAVVDRVAITGDGSLSALALADGTVRFVSNEGIEEGTSIEVGGRISNIRLDRHGERVLVASGPKLLLADVELGEVISTYRVDERFTIPITDLSSDGQTAVLTLAAIDIFDVDPFATEVVDLATGQLIARLEEAERVLGLDVSSDGRIVTGYSSGSVLVRSSDGTGQPLRLLAHSAELTDVTVGDDGTVLTAAADETVRFWTLDGAVLDNPLTVDGEVADTAVAANGRIVISLRGRGLLIVDPDASAIVRDEHDVPTFSQLGAYLPFYDRPSDDFGGVMWFDLEDGELIGEVRLVEAHPNGFGQPFYSTDGKWMSTHDLGSFVAAISEVGGDRQVLVDLNVLYERLFGVPGNLSTTFFKALPEAGGDRVLFMARGSGDEWAAAWFDVVSGEIDAGPLVDAGGGATEAVPLRDGRVVVGGQQSTIKILPADLESPPVEVPGTEGLVPLHEHPDAPLVLAAGFDSRIGLIDLATATVEFVEGGSGLIYSGAFSSAGDAFAVASLSRGVMLFDLAARRPLGVPMLQRSLGNEGGFGLRWSDDGSGVWIAPEGGPVRFSSDPDDWVTAACDIVERELNIDEWRTFVSPTTGPVSACGG